VLGPSAWRACVRWPPRRDAPPPAGSPEAGVRSGRRVLTAVRQRPRRLAAGQAGRPAASRSRSPVTCTSRAGRACRVHRAARRGHRRREHGEQPRARLRADGPGRHADGSQARALPRAGHRRQGLAGAGANVIVGSHAHVLQGSGWLGRTFVAYGMASFLWWEASYSTSTGVLMLTLHRRGPLSARFVPATVSSTGQPVVDAGSGARQARARYRSLRACTRLSAHPGRNVLFIPSARRPVR
jgi:Bacterial capsule synthesis protein PGA_cap